MTEKDYVEINHSWMVTGNPFGSGLALLVNRGINCENHTQVVTVHATNTPGIEFVRQVVERDREMLNKWINGFVEFITSFGWSRSQDSAFKEMVGVMFQRHLLEHIVHEAEKLEYPS